MEKRFDALAQSHEALVREVSRLKAQRDGPAATTTSDGPGAEHSSTSSGGTTAGMPEVIWQWERAATKVKSHGAAAGRRLSSRSQDVQLGSAEAYVAKGNVG